MDNIMDPELASEMVKLLAQELKVVRAQLREAERVCRFCGFLGLRFIIPSTIQRTSTPHTGGPSNTLMRERAQELISENDTLKADNAALQERVTRLQDELTQVSSIKSEEDLPSSLQHAEVVASTAACRPRTTNMPLLSRRLTSGKNSPDCLPKMRISSAKRWWCVFLHVYKFTRLRPQEEASRNQEKLSILQEKYRRSKAKCHEYNEARKIPLYYDVHWSCDPATDLERASCRALELH